MLGRHEPQLGFTNIKILESWAKGDLVPKDSVYYALSQTDDIFRDDLFAEAYSPVGRPSTPPSRLVKVLMLQVLEDVSDREAENRARYDLRWKVALGINLDEAGFDYCSLSFFRTRLLLSNTHRKAFEAVLQAAADKGMIPQDQVRLIIDSTYVLGAGAVQDTYTLVRLAIRSLIREIERKKARRCSLKELLPAPLRLDYQTRNKPKINWDDSVQRENLLNDLVSDAKALLAATEQIDLTRREKELRDTLATVAFQDVISDEDGRVSLKQGVAKDRVISTSDPEMRHGHKSSHRRFDGYKLHATIESTRGFVTGIDVTPGNVHDSQAVTTLIDNQPVQVDSLLGDAAYGTGDARAELEERHVKVIAPVAGNCGRVGFFSKSDFQIDLNNVTCRCPMGYYAPTKVQSRSKQLKGFAFSEEQCGNCPLRGQCFDNKHGYRTVSVNLHERQLQEGRAYTRTAEFAQAYAERYKIEQKIAELSRSGGRKARYIGKAKVLLQALFVATAVNFKRYVKLLGEPLEPGVSPLAAGT